MNNNLVLYIASSQDGFISGESDDLSFLKSVEIEGEDYGYLKFIDSVGPILVGRKTYDKVISMEITLSYVFLPTNIGPTESINFK